MRFRLGRVRCTPLFTGWSTKGGSQAEWGASENNRKAKFYSLTKTGQKQLQAELEDWGRISTAIASSAEVGGQMLKEWLTRLRFLMSPKPNREIDDEVQFHIERQTQEYIADWNDATGGTPKSGRSVRGN